MTAWGTVQDGSGKSSSPSHVEEVFSGVAPRDVRNPVVLFLHEGPGTSQLTSDRQNTRDLGKHFTVVDWDQRGAGRSYAAMLRVPVFFVEGRHDHESPAELAERYFAAPAAPWKELVWFENSAHVPNPEERDRFIRFMVEQVLPVATRHDDR